ncbi:MAG: GAF domain-containing SpoIIE family protein phosphatase [Bacteroidota bacterium]
MKPRLINGILLISAVLLWATLLVFHWYDSALGIFDEVGAVSVWVGSWIYKVVTAAFFLTKGILVWRWFRQVEEFHVTTQLWRLFIIGMGGITVIMLTTFASQATADMNSHRYLVPLYFFLGLYALLMFFLSSVFIYQRFILYPRTRRKLTAWQIFLGFLALSILQPFLADGIYILVAFLLFVGLSLALSINVRWVAYLNFQQKLRALGLLGLIMLVIIVYGIAAQTLPVRLEMVGMELLRLEFLYYIMVFGVAYTGVSILILFFNLPTTSIFEKQSSEIASFQKINHAIQSNLDFTEIMQTLLDASMMAANARAGWIELLQDDGEVKLIHSQRISQGEVKEIKQDYDLTDKVTRDQKYYLVRNTRKHRAFRQSSSKYKCLLAVPIVSNQRAYGAVFMVNELINSFEDVTIQSVNLFAEQAGISLENARLIKNSIEVERYQEQLKIAQEVQSKLLPRELPFTNEIQFGAVSEAAQEVGGDYFDVVQVNPHTYRVAIGDVSGKGTTAAFYMAEIKGIFHALSLLDLSVRQIIETANLALSRCMQRGFFMTFTFLEIDLKARKIEMIRAGHCPTYHFGTERTGVCRLDDGTIGLGIVRTPHFSSLVEKTEHLAIHAGDTLVLYTDGINEARNAEGEEFGYDRLQEAIETNRKMSPKELATSIVDSVRNFAHSDPQDDYTVLVIHFP